MCGIVGIYGFEDKELIKRMTDSIEHRGPDDKGFYFDKNLCLGHRRLSIIDLSEKGKQPIFNKDRSLVIIYNGEIFNFQDIRKELEKKGYKFESQTDTEVLIKAYEEYGVKCLEKLNGFFAFAIWDSKKKKLLLARDRLGVKPLYYTKNKDYFIFASEIKSILQYEEFERKINWTAIDSFLSLRYIPNNLTPLENIYKLDPGNYIIFDATNNSLTIKRYWDITYKENNFSLDKNIAVLNKLFEDSIKIRMISDVPVGGFIGGGIDSTTIINYMAKNTEKPIETFTIGFENGEDTNEYDHAQEVAEYYNTNHHEIEMKATDIILLPKIVWHLDEPMADPNSVPLYILTREARKKVTVVLTGEGGDEVFGGYEQYKIMQKLDNYTKNIPLKLISKLALTTSRVTPKNSFLNKLLTFTSTLANKPNSYLELLSIFNCLEKNHLYTKSTAEHVVEDYAHKVFNAYFNNDYGLLNKMLLTDTKTLLPENLLMNLDKIAMANSMEGRTPFLDYRIVEFAATIKPQLKLNGLNEKFILKKTMQGKVPRRVIERKKQRFHVPIDNWYNPYLKNFSENIINQSEITKRGYFDKEYIRKLLNYQNTLSYKLILKHNNLTKLYYTRQLWSIIIFEIWNRIFIEGDIKKPKLSLDKF